MERILVHCPNLIGDTVMATPLLRALRLHWADARIDVVVKPAVAPTLDGLDWIDERILHDPRSKRVEQRAAATVQAIRAGDYELGLLLPNSFRSALLFWRGKVRRRVGYARGGRGPLLHDRLKAPRDARGQFVPTPAVEYYAALLRPIGVNLGSLRLELATTAVDEAAADSVWSRFQLGMADRPVVCLNTGGAFGPAKNWPIDSFATLARRLAETHDADVLVLCGPAERENARAIAVQAGHPRVFSLDDCPLSIGLSKACVRRSALLVTTDSGPRHFAAAFRVPVVTLFGPTHIAWTRTQHPHAIHLQQRLPCGPCQKPICPEGHHRCMRELTPDAVYQAAQRLLEMQPSRPGPLPPRVEHPATC